MSEFARIEGLATSVRADGFSAECLDACARAALWLRSQDPRELAGDDSVGWWLLLYAGMRIPAEVRRRLRSQLTAALPRVAMGRSEVYTVTAVARTLARAGALGNPGRVRASLREALNGAGEGSAAPEAGGRHAARDVVWCLQALYELGPLARPSRDKRVRSLLVGISRADALAACMLWPVAHSQLAAADLDAIGEQTDALGKGMVQGLLSEHLDWENSYLLLYCVRRGLMAEAATLAKYLVSRQVDSQWDEETDENIESTSLVGLALCAYLAAGAARGLMEGGSEKVAGELLSHVLHREVTEPRSLEEEWETVVATVDAARKGGVLERFFRLYAGRDPVLRVESTNVRTESEEIDLILENRAGTTFFRKLQTSLILVECKFRTERASAAMVRDFVAKVEARSRLLCNVGLLASMAGFSEDAEQELFRCNARHEGILVASLTGEDLGGAVEQSLDLSVLIEARLLDATKR